MGVFLAALVSVLSLGIALLHAWAGRAHFRSERMPPGAMALSAAVTITLLALLVLVWINQPPPVALLAGVLIEAASLALFLSAMRASREARLKLAFDAAHPHGIVQTGPYRFVRHPFYTSYLLFWIGLALATWSLWALPLLALMTAIYVAAAAGEERKFDSSPLAADYGAYRARAGMFWPRIPAQQKGGP